MKVEDPIDKRHLTPLGRVIAEYNVLELAALMFIRTLLNTDEGAAEIVVQRLSARQRLELLKDLHQLRVKDDTKAKAFEKVWKRALFVTEKRNQFAHSLYIARPLDPKFTKKNIGLHPNAASPAEMENVAAEVAAVRNELMEMALADMFKDMFKDLKFDFSGLGSRPRK